MNKRKDNNHTDHVAIMKKSWGLLPQVLTGEKTIESRWYMNRSAPWGKIKAWDSVYFKNSGEPVTVIAEVSKVLTFEGLTPIKVREILKAYGTQDGIEEKDIPHYANLFKDKKYCLLIFLRKAQPIEPFTINKKGYGAMAAWLSTPDINKLRNYGKKLSTNKISRGNIKVSSH
ncbi:MAG: hypothetical protein JWN89_32 [Parcubacteria group bacterium]|nr:hypothetical protein [Parcubacteria group bacterium]